MFPPSVEEHFQWLMDVAVLSLWKGCCLWPRDGPVAFCQDIARFWVENNLSSNCSSISLEAGKSLFFFYVFEPRRRISCARLDIQSGKQFSERVNLSFLILPGISQLSLPMLALALGRTFWLFLSLSKVVSTVVSNKRRSGPRNGWKRRGGQSAMIQGGGW